LVDIALASVQEHSGVTSSVSPDEELAALRAEVNKLAESAAEIGSASVCVLRAKSEDVLEDARTRIREQPLMSIGPGRRFFVRRRPLRLDKIGPVPQVRGTSSSRLNI
jgi:hypothetical protein